MNNQRVSSEELDLSGDGLLVLWRGEPFAGIEVEHTPEGVTYETAYVDGLKDGLSRVIRSDGTVLEESNYYRGAHHGTLRRWATPGKLVLEAEYELGIKLRERAWNEDGTLVKEFALPENSPMRATLAGLRQWREQNEGPLTSKPHIPPDDSEQ